VASALLPLPPTEAHLWCARLDPARDDQLVAAATGLLSDDEWTRYHRYLFAEGRRQFLASRIVVRSVLSRYHPVDARAWRFDENAFGRPEIAAGLTPSPVRFNITNTVGLVACVLSGHHDVGVDAERFDRRMALDVAESHFSRDEVLALRSLPGHEQRGRFLEYWTLKEAYIKARGMGLAIALEQFSFELVPGKPIEVRFDARLGDEEAAWQFAHLRPTPDHLLAVAVRSAGREVAIVERPLDLH
jgi:4'-phosphopantetheinyl transferase